MTAPMPAGGDAWWRQGLARLHRIRPVIAVMALVFVGLIVAGALSGPAALSAFVLMVIAAAVAVGGTESASTALEPGSRAAPPLDPLAIETLISAVPDAIVALVGDGTVVAFNSRAAAIAPALRRGEPISLALRQPDLLDAVRGAAATRTPHRAEIVDRVPLDRWLEIVVQPVSWPQPAGNGLDLLVMTFHDQTPLRRVEAMRADFVANASHELRTPLAALRGFIETLQGPARDDAAARERFLGIMQAQAMRMARLIDDLLSLSRIELNVHRHPDQTLDLAPLLRQVADTLQPLARERGVDIGLHIEDAPLTVLADRDELTRVFDNLVENGLKYGASGKRVDVQAARGGPQRNEAVVVVRDYGPGIAPEHLPRLTERFYRVDVADSRAQGGTGLGLALVKHILARHGGRLQIASVFGRGATFTVRLPLVIGGK